MGQVGDLIRTDISIADGKIALPQAMAVDMGGAMVFPAFVDMHTHLDKGHIWGPCAQSRWQLHGGAGHGGGQTGLPIGRPRMSAPGWAFRCAAPYAHGTRAIRTHLDSIPPQDSISFPVFRELQAEWAGRIDLQAVCLVGCDHWTDDDGPFGASADHVAQSPGGGPWGWSTYPVPDLRDRLRGFFQQAADRSLDADFHVDETMDPSVENTARHRGAEARNRV